MIKQITTTVCDQCGVEDGCSSLILTVTKHGKAGIYRRGVVDLCTVCEQELLTPIMRLTRAAPRRSSKTDS